MSTQAIDDERLGARLLDYLSQTFAARELAYAARPTRIKGGFDAAIFGFALREAPSELAGPLILRLGRTGANAARFRMEAAVQNGLAAMAFPAPRVAVVEAGTAALGGPFMIMQRLAGRTLASEVEGLLEGASLVRKIRGIAGLPALFERISGTWADTQLKLHNLPAEPFVQAVVAAGVDERVITFEGQRARIGDAIESGGLSGLKPALVWLDANDPGGPRTTICHGDFHPLNIMADAGQVTGVIDWANVVVAAPEMDVGSALTNITAAPLEVPFAVRPMLRMAIRSGLAAYLRAYRRKRPLDDRAVRFYQVFRALHQLTWSAITVRNGLAGGGAFGSEAGIRNLIAYIERCAGVEVEV